MEIKMNINEIAGRLFPALTKLSVVEQKYSLGLYRILAEGEPVSREKLSAELDISREEVDLFLKDRPGIYYDNGQNIVGYMGLAISKMAHRFTVNNKILYTWCAWDSLFIPALLNKTAHVESVCQATKEPVTLTVSPDGVENLHPADAVMSILIPDAGDKDFTENCCEDVISSFCHFVCFFKSYEAGATWINNKKENYVLLSIEEASELGRQHNNYAHRDALSEEVI